MKLPESDRCHCEHWAELFGDMGGLERFGLVNAQTPEDRAALYRRLGRYADADAAKVPLDTLAEVDDLDALRQRIPSWNRVGLGRMSTQACYELAAVAKDATTGRHLWSTAERWRGDLSSFPLVGLQAALAAATRWGEPRDVAELDAAVRTEHDRIYGPP